MTEASPSVCLILATALIVQTYRILGILCALGKFVIGRVIKAMQANWHPDCFRCEICNDRLADSGFVKNAGR